MRGDDPGMDAWQQHVDRTLAALQAGVDIPGAVSSGDHD
jgi:hypothetical protein